MKVIIRDIKSREALATMNDMASDAFVANLLEYYHSKGHTVVVEKWNVL